MIKLLGKVTKWTLVVMILFFGTQVCFKWLNEKSTILNILGLVGILYMATFVIYHTTNFIKKQFKSED